MKSKLRLALLSVSLAVATVAIGSELILSTSTKTGGVTTTVTVGRVQGEPAADGSMTLTVIPREIVTLADGTVISDKFAGEWLSVPLPADTVALFNEAIASAQAASNALKAKAKADADAAKAAAVVPATP